MYTLKNKNPFLILFLLLVLSSAACHFKNHHTRTVKMNDGTTSLKIEYCGEVAFNEDGTGIDAIAPLGYIKYENNGRRLYAESDENGSIRYKLYDGNRRLHMNDPEAQRFMSHAVKVMEEHYAR